MERVYLARVCEGTGVHAAGRDLNHPDAGEAGLGVHDVAGPRVGVHAALPVLITSPSVRLRLVIYRQAVPPPNGCLDNVDPLQRRHSPWLPLGRPAARSISRNPAWKMLHDLRQIRIATEFRHAPVVGKVLSPRGHETSSWHYQSRKRIPTTGACSKSFALPL